jgi:hypothetical protein
MILDGDWPVSFGLCASLCNFCFVSLGLGPVWEERIGLKGMECKEYFKNISFIHLFRSLSMREWSFIPLFRSLSMRE